MKQNSKPVFVLGVGAQKAGTTWLHAYLSQSRETDMGLAKEYHIWDGLTVPEFSEFDVRLKRFVLRRRARDLRNRVTGQQREKDFLRRDMQKDPEYYFDYFAELLEKHDTRITGDITPSYSALSAQTLSQIRNGFSKRGITTKIIFLMRDPVDRCLSAIRMYRRKGLSKQGVDITMTSEGALKAYIESRQAHLRTHYHHTLEAVSNVFDAVDIYVGVYETMFHREEFDRLNEFLGLDGDYSFAAEHFNVTEKTSALDPDLLQEAARAFAPVYEYCFARYPELKDHWRNPDL